MSTTNNRLTAEELQKLRQTDFMGKPGFVKAETLLTKEVGEIGTPQRAEFDAGETDLQLSSFIRIAEALGITIRLDVNLA